MRGNDRYCSLSSGCLLFCYLFSFWWCDVNESKLKKREIGEAIVNAKDNNVLKNSVLVNRKLNESRFEF